MKPIPKPVYPCYQCAGLNTWSSDDLFWSNHDQDWVCDMCWDDRDIEEDKGICLADEIKQASPKLGPDVIEMARNYAANKVRPDQSAEDYDLAILEYKYQLRQKAQVTK